MVHLGFYKGYANIQEQLLTAINIELWRHSNASILVTGHSLGGALATLAAVDIKLHMPSLQVDFYTLGSPRVGN